MAAVDDNRVSATEEQRIYRWRFEELVRSGYEMDAARTLAECLEVDLHEATGLLQRGCPNETALRILL